ncbi:MAG TPA: hypothetical protein VGM81_01510 [Burkholderiaceae bacterium]|jgi:hypothetical protein
MHTPFPFPTALQARPGVTIGAAKGGALQGMTQMLDRLGLASAVDLNETRVGLHLALKDAVSACVAPGGDTLQIAARLGPLEAPGASALEREILATLLASPLALAFPDWGEFESAVRTRQYIAEAAACTQLAFDTRAIERPQDCWTYSEDLGFTIRPGVPLIEALARTTQPAPAGPRYAFSCYRATEYVILLGLAQELARSNPALLQRLQQRWERKAIMSGAFHEAFLVEHGSIDQPVPARHYVPGDRVWFRNPDAVSSDVSGYEGSWVIYLGRGLFSNFWQPGAPYTLERKCLEVFHWRHGVFVDDAGEPQMDEDAVSDGVQRSLVASEEAQAIVERMMRVRDPKGVYAEGGCIDASREHPRFVRPGTTDICLDV